MPASFRAEAYRTETSLGAPDAWRPLQVGPQAPGYMGHNYQMWARLRPGVTLAQARAELVALDAALYRAHPVYLRYQNGANQLPHCAVYPLASVLASDVRPSLLVMAAAAGTVLLLACLNLAGLNTARALKRRPELALRAALGASRGRLLRLALMEAALLAMAGAAGAALLARLLLPFLLRTAPVAIPQVSGAASSWTAAGLAAGIACISAFVFGAPMATVALRQSRPEALGVTRTSGTGKQQARAGKLLIVAQMSLTVVLLSAASLLLGTFLKLRAQPLGFSPDKLAVFQTSLRGERYTTTAATGRFVETVLGKLRSAPGVRSAAAVSGLPLDGGLNDTSWPDARSSTVEATEFRAATPGYLQTMGIPLLAGRGLLPSDTATSLSVAVISATTAARWWPGRSALGAEIHTGSKTSYRVVGIAADVPGRSPADRPKVLLYTPLAQLANSDTKTLTGWFPISFTVRLAANIDLARMAAQAVAEADPEIPVTKLATMGEIIDDSVAAPRFFAQLAQGFAGFAVLLTAIGLFGLLSYQVAGRTREIGIRMALGASRGSILRGVVGGGAALAGSGALLGGAAALLLRPLLTLWIAEYVVGVAPTNHAVLFNGSLAILTALTLLGATTLVASALPARRAAQVEPIEALRTE